MRRLTPLLVGLLLLALGSAAQAQGNIRVVTSCGSQTYTPQDGTAQFMTMDTTGKLCISATSSGSPYAPDVSVVAVGGTAVNAFSAGDAAKGGFISNPSTASGPLCINITGTAATSDGGGTSCIIAGQTYTIPNPFTGAVSVNAADSGHVFSGVGYR